MQLTFFKFTGCVAEKGIYFIFGYDPDCRCHHLQFLELTSEQITTVVDLEVPSWGFSVSPDGHSLLYTQRTVFDSDAMMVENFR